MINGQEVLIIVAAASAALLVLVAVLLWLLRDHKKLKNSYHLLAAQIQRNSDDVAGLCSAAVAVDQRMTMNEVRLDGLFELVSTSQLPQQAEEQHEEEPRAQGYDQAIEKIRRGANVDELVKSCGLTRDEALLLMRLHGTS